MKRVFACVAVIAAFLLFVSCENPLFVEATRLYKVDFETNGGSSIPSCRTDKIESAPTTQKEGERFIGWYTNAAFAGAQISFPFSPAGNTILYAKWLKTYHVRFETNGGSEVPDMDTDIITDPPASTKEGWTLLGWSADSESKKQISFPYELTEDTTLRALWTESSNTLYKVEHYKQSLSLAEDFESYVFAEFETLAGKTNYLTQALAKNYEGFVPKTFSQETIRADGSTVVKILYDREKYIVAFNANGGTGTMDAQEFYYGVSKALKANAFEKQDCVFAGWATTADGVSLYGDGDYYSANANATLYAVWREIESTSYKVEHWKQTALLDSYELAIDGVETLFGKQGAQTAAAAKSYAGFSSKAFSQKTIAADGSTLVKIYYDREKYAVSFNGNGASGDMPCQDFYYGVPQALSANTFEKPGYSFDGWTESADGEILYQDGQNVTVNGAKTLYAKWFYGVAATNETVKDLNLTSLFDSCVVKICGGISNSTLETLAQKIALANKDITLDLSKSHGLVAVSPTSENESVFKNCAKLKSVLLPDGLSTIGSYAFKNCAISSVYIPPSVKTIGSRAFYRCKNIDSIKMDGVETIGDSCFYACKALTNVSIKNAKTVGSCAFAYCDSLKTACLENIQEVGGCSFCNDVNLESVVLANVNSIGIRAFSKDGKLSRISMTNVNEIRDFAFEKCANLADVKIDACIVEQGAFENCAVLTSVTIGSRVAELRNYYKSSSEAHKVFEGCGALSSVAFEDAINWLYKFSNSYSVSLDLGNAASNASYLKGYRGEYVWYKEK